tara:strand:+ start:531 stop:737 length:207 start_codon:yes stop_codon:yes gene_type:complete
MEVKSFPMTKKIDPSEYMVEGWDTIPPGYEVKYKRGSYHNKIGMTIMFTYYALFVGMFIRGLIVFLNL